ncbi:hypothetical protein K3495_g2021 [Podosphaera aphanis]|nr:hypothetical protein K3495_g2021 [Podosphaera aphanis]
MGLAAPKKKIKLSRDPNNTKWTNNTESFGLKIMTSQGWKQGEYLGAKNSSHAEFHTSANACPIKVSVKDDNLGLGAKVGSGVGHGECTGLDAFKNLLSRLNGKAQDEIDKEQKARDDIRRITYTEKRWGSIRFVSAGFLIGDQIQTLIDAEAKRVGGLQKDTTPRSTTDSHSEVCSANEGNSTEEKPAKTKKRKLRENDLSQTDNPNEKKRKKKKRKRDIDNTEDENVLPVGKRETKKAQKARKVKLEGERSNSELEGQKKKSKKNEQKDIERSKKDRKKSKEGVTKSKDSEVLTKKKKKDDKSADLPVIEAPETLSKVEINSQPTTSTGEVGHPKSLMQGRHAVRARNIAQKRLASMDVAALNQIFMIKA